MFINYRQKYEYRDKYEYNINFYDKIIPVVINGGFVVYKLVKADGSIEWYKDITCFDLYEPKKFYSVDEMEYYNVNFTDYIEHEQCEPIDVDEYFNNLDYDNLDKCSIGIDFPNVFYEDGTPCVFPKYYLGTIDNPEYCLACFEKYKNSYFMPHHTRIVQDGNTCYIEVFECLCEIVELEILQGIVEKINCCGFGCEADICKHHDNNVYDIYGNPFCVNKDISECCNYVCEIMYNNYCVNKKTIYNAYNDLCSCISNIVDQNNMSYISSFEQTLFFEKNGICKYIEKQILSEVLRLDTELFKKIYEENLKNIDDKDIAYNLSIVQYLDKIFGINNYCLDFKSGYIYFSKTETAKKDSCEKCGEINCAMKELEHNLNEDCKCTLYKEYYTTLGLYVSGYASCTGQLYNYKLRHQPDYDYAKSMCGGTFYDIGGYVQNNYTCFCGLNCNDNFKDLFSDTYGTECVFHGYDCCGINATNPGCFSTNTSIHTWFSRY